MLKRLISMMLICVMCISVVACGKQAAENETSGKNMTMENVDAGTKETEGMVNNQVTPSMSDTQMTIDEVSEVAKNESWINSIDYETIYREYVVNGQLWEQYRYGLMLAGYLDIQSDGLMELYLILSDSKNEIDRRCILYITKEKEVRCLEFNLAEIMWNSKAIIQCVTDAGMGWIYAYDENSGIWTKKADVPVEASNISGSYWTELGKLNTTFDELMFPKTPKNWFIYNDEYWW